MKRSRIYTIMIPNLSEFSILVVKIRIIPKKFIHILGITCLLNMEHTNFFSKNENNISNKNRKKK